VLNQHKRRFRASLTLQSWHEVGAVGAQFDRDASRVRFAASFDPRLARVLRRLPLDVPIAATWRDLGRAAAGLELERPSYACVRLHVADERLRRAERRATVEVAATLAFTRSIAPNVDAVAAQYHDRVQRHLEVR
jgi:hypothetical protein